MIKRLVLELDEDIHQKIKQKALKNKESMRDVMLKLLNEWMNKK